jgi:exodeoxyribonuclease VIII
MQHGIYYDISNETYHSGAIISKSQLDDIAINLAIFQWRKSTPEDEEKKAAQNTRLCTACLWSQSSLITALS